MAKATSPLPASAISVSMAGRRDSGGALFGGVVAVMDFVGRGVRAFDAGVRKPVFTDVGKRTWCIVSFWEFPSA
jgi:hypothetical protein